MPDGRAARGASARRPSLKRQLLVMFLCVIIPVSVLLSLLLVSAADYSRSRLAHTSASGLQMFASTLERQMLSVESYLVNLSLNDETFRTLSAENSRTRCYLDICAVTQSFPALLAANDTLMGLVLVNSANGMYRGRYSAAAPSDGAALELNLALEGYVTRIDFARYLDTEGWYIDRVGKRFDRKISTFGDLIDAMRQSHDYFAEKGCLATDHGLELPLRADYLFEDADRIFRRALAGEALTAAEMDCYMGAFLAEAAALNAEKGWVTQLHLGAVRDVRARLFDALGPDVGGDVSSHYQDFLPALVSFLNRFDSRLKVVLYCLDQTHQATLATLARAFGENVRLGSAWWLCDHPTGMRRQLEYIGAVDVYWNFAGMVSDSRKLLSYGSRFEMFRRVLADVLGSLVEYGQMPEEETMKLAVAMAYAEPKRFWNL